MDRKGRGKCRAIDEHRRHLDHRCRQGKGEKWVAGGEGLNAWRVNGSSPMKDAWVVV